NFRQIEAHERVQTKSVGRGQDGADGQIILYCSRCANPDDVKCTTLVLNFTGLKVNIHQCIQFIEHDVYIVCSYASRNNTQPGFANIAGMRNKLSLTFPNFYTVKIAGHLSYTIRITNCDNSVSKILGA